MVHPWSRARVVRNLLSHLHHFCHNVNNRHFPSLILLAFLAMSGWNSAYSQTNLQTLHNQVRPVVAEGKVRSAGAMPEDEQLSFSIVLPLRNEAQLDSLLHSLYDPTSPDYRQFLSVADFTEKFGPSEQDYAAVVAFAKANGLQVTGTPSNRLVVPLKGSVRAVNAVLHVQMNLYQHPTEDRMFFSPDREPSLALNVPIAHIAGLNNYSKPKPMTQKSVDGRLASDIIGSGPGGSYLASDMRSAYYGGTQLTGSGQSVGLVEFGGYYLSDVNQTFSSAGQSYSVPINNVLIDGASAEPLENEADAEQVLDIVQAIGMAPGLSQVRVYIGTGPDDANVLNAMASENIAKSLSCSWGWLPEDPGTDDVFFKEFAAQGQSFFVASGDYGAWDTAIDPYVYPSEDDYVTTVGGTHLTTLSAGGAWQTETAWNSSLFGSGGGISPDGIAIPSWQSGLSNSSNGASTTLRNGPDVAMEADFDNFSCELGSCNGGYAGTSFAAPRWAGFVALVNQQAVEAGTAPKGGIGFLNPAIYSIGAGAKYSSDFHDIESGNNLTDSQPKWYNAVDGYDLVTGWGSPTGQSLINDLAGKQVLGFWLSASSSNVEMNPGGTGSTTISLVDAGGFTGKVQLAITSALPAGVTAKWGTNPASETSVLTLTAASTAANTTTTVTISGTSGSITKTTQITLTVHTPSFSLSTAPGGVEVIQGNSATASVAVTPLYGFTGSVKLSVSGLPAGVTATLGTNPTTGTSQLTINASSTASPVTSNVTITGTSGSVTASTTLELVIEKPTFTLASGGNVNLGPGTSASTYILVQDQFGFSGSVNLSVSGMPSGVTALLSPNPTTGSSILTLTAGSTAPLGSSTLTVMGVSGSLTATTTLKLNVLAPAFTLSTLGATAIGKGTTTTIPLSVTPEYGFNSAVNLSVSGLPSGVTASVTPNPATGYTSLILTASSTAATGTGNVTITGTSGSLKATTSFSLGVFVPTFTLTGNGPVSMIPGSSSTNYLYVNSLYGFNGSVNLSVSGLPSGVTASFSPNPTTETAALTLSASTSVPLGTSTVTITGTSGTQTVKTTITLGIVQPAFTLFGPTSVNLGIGTSSSASVYVSPEYGFTGSVNLALSGLPTGVTASITPNPTTGAGVLMLTAGSTAKPGSYTVTITGTAIGAKPVSNAFPLTVANPGFTLSNSGQLQLGQGTSTSTSIQVNPSNGFTGSVHLAVSGLPSGVTASFNPSLVTGGASILTLTASSTATTGSSTLTITGTSGTQTETTTVPLQVGAPSFTITTVGGLTITPGGTVSTSIAVNPQNGFTGSVSLSASGLPTGITASFSPNLTSGNSVLTLTASSTTALGNATVTLVGTWGSKKVSTTLPLTIATPSFFLSVPGTPVQLASGGTAMTGVSVSWGANTIGTVSLAVSGLPSGVTASFSPSSTNYYSFLTFQATSAAAHGLTTLTITGTVGKTTSTTTLQLQIEPPSFTLSMPYTVAVGQGQSVTDSISINPAFGFNGAVKFSISGLPAGVTAAWSLNPAESNSVLTLTATNTAALTSSTVTITGTSGSVTASANFQLLVSPQAFTINTGFVTLGQGTTTSTFVNITPLNGFNGSVNLAVAGLPAGVTASFSLASTNSYSTLTLTASSTASLGQYNAIITGTSGKLTASTVLNVTVAAPGFTLQQDSAQIGQGSSTTTYVGVNPQNGFTGSVQLSVVGLPSGVTASFLPNPTNSNSTLILKASSTAALGEYNATIVGTYGKQTASAPLNVSVYVPTFTLYGYQVTVNPGSSSQAYLYVTPMYGFTGQVLLSVSGLPAGVTASFSPNPTTGESTVTFAANSSASPGEYNLTVTGTSGTQTSTAILPLTVSIPTFTLWTSNINVGQGTSATSTVIIASPNGFNQAVRFTAAGLPAGVTASFSPNPATGSTSMTLSASSTASSGQYTVTISGTGGGQTASTTVLVMVAPPSFTLTTYSNLQAGQGSSAIGYVYVYPANGFNGQVQFSATGLPTGVTASFSPASSATSTTMTLAAASSVKAGQYSFTLVGRSGSLASSTPVSFTVLPPTFTISSASYVPLGQGASTTTYVNVVGQNGFSSSVNLAVSGLPSGVTAAFSPNPTTSQSTLTFKATSTASPGQYTVTISGTGGGQTASTPIELVVAAPSFTLTTYGNLQVGQGSSAIEYVYVNPAYGFNGQVQFSATGLPAGMTASFSPASSATNTGVTLTTSSSVKPGQYSFNVAGRSGSLVASTTLSVTVMTSTFTLNNWGGANVGQGTSATAYININGEYGFSGNVNLSISGLPSGVTASFSPNPATSQSVLTFKASSTASLGQYTVIVTGTSGTQTATTAVTLGVYVPTFTLNDSTNVNIGQGTSATVPVYMNPQYGFAGSVNLSVSGLPSGVTASFSPNPTTGQSILTLTASSTAVLGQCVLTITGTSGTQTSSTPLTLGVYTPTFTLVAPVTMAVGQGATTETYLDLNAPYGIAGKVQLSASGLPTGVTASFSPNPTTSSPSMTFTASSTAALGQFTVKVTGTAGSQTASTSVALGVYVPTFTVVDYAGSMSLSPGQSGETYVIVYDEYGFSGNVQFSISGLPAGVTAAFSPNPATGESMLTLTVATSAKAGQYPLTITGTSGSQKASTSFGLTVN